MYSETDLRDLAKYLREVADAGTSEEGTDETQDLVKLYRALEVLRYNPTLCWDALQEYGLCDLLKVPLDDVPMHNNDEGLLAKTVFRWRCNKAR